MLQARVKYTREAMAKRLRQTEIELGLSKIALVLERKRRSTLSESFQRWKAAARARSSRARLAHVDSAHAPRELREMLEDSLRERDYLLDELVVLRGELLRARSASPSPSFNSPTHAFEKSQLEGLRMSVAKQAHELLETLQGLNARSHAAQS